MATLKRSSLEYMFFASSELRCELLTFFKCLRQIFTASSICFCVGLHTVGPEPGYTMVGREVSRS